MTYTVLASDYDGTLAKDGRVDESTLQALERWRQSNRQLVLITGRVFEDLLQICPCLPLFDWVVAENGAMLYEPATKRELLLGDRPSEVFIQKLRERIHTAVQQQQAEDSSQGQSGRSQDSLVSHGRIIVATWEPYSNEARALIQELGLDLQIILNKSAVMLLPTGLDKAAGIKAVSQELKTPLASFVGVGDAENDLAFLKCCGYSVAVANAIPEIKRQVSTVTQAERGAGVAELIEQLLNS
ncbi:MAG: HAD family hydrolase [Cyanobacteria bacterium J06638_22]